MWEKHLGQKLFKTMILKSVSVFTVTNCFLAFVVLEFRV